MEKFLQKKYVVPVIILAIMLGAFFVRFYNFQDWLYFKMDQARDAFVIANAVENGAGELPLLGARAGATELESGFLRLGPISYYFQYLSGVLFSSISPDVFAYPDLFFSILTLPLLYLFARLYFSQKISLLILFMYAFSFIVIQYSRFAWNPNSLQFFILLSFYGLLRFLNEKEEKTKKWWLALWALGITIGSQLHFFGFFSLLGISAMSIFFHFKLWKKENIFSCFRKQIFGKIAKYSVIFILIFTIFYTPVIISDVFTKGENTKNFIQALGSKAEKKPITEKISKSVQENLRYYCLIGTSQCVKEKFESDLLIKIFSGIFVLLGILISIIYLRKIEDGLRKDFLILILSWFFVFSILSIPVAFQLRPRFFIVVFAVPFILLGIIYEFLENRFGKKGFFISVFLTIFIFVSNMSGTYAWFSEQKKSQNEDAPIERTLILKVKDGITLGQLRGASDYIYAHRKKDANIYFYTKPELVRPIEYLFFEKKDESFKYYTLKINQDPAAQYFAIVSSSSKTKAISEKFGNDFEILSEKQFGQIIVYEIDFKNRNISDEFEINEKNSTEDRIFWKDVL